MDRLLRAEEQFPPVEETCWGVRDVSWADKGCTGEVDIIVDNKDFLHSADFWNLCAVFQINCVTYFKGSV